jgi:hypothetical protein
MRAEFTRDGIAYTVVVYHVQGAYFASWTCTKCKVTGGPTHDCDNAEDAIARAQARAFSEHHFDRHVVVAKSAIKQMMEGRRSASPAAATAPWCDRG